MTNYLLIEAGQMQALIQQSINTNHEVGLMWPALVVVAAVQVLVLGLLIAKTKD